MSIAGNAHGSAFPLRAPNPLSPRPSPASFTPSTCNEFALKRRLHASPLSRLRPSVLIGRSVYSLTNPLTWQMHSTISSETGDGREGEGAGERILEERARNDIVGSTIR